MKLEKKCFSFIMAYSFGLVVFTSLFYVGLLDSDPGMNSTMEEGNQITGGFLTESLDDKEEIADNIVSENKTFSDNNPS